MIEYTSEYTDYFAISSHCNLSCIAAAGSLLNRQITVKIHKMSAYLRTAGAIS